MTDREFLNQTYMGADGEDFKKEFAEYLEKIINDQGRWTAMSDYALYLHGARDALKEVIDEVKKSIHLQEE